jgi:hypothetical protein
VGRAPIAEPGGRLATAAEIQSFEQREESWDRQHPEPPPQYGLFFDAWDDIVEQSFSAWHPAADEQSRFIRLAFHRLDELAANLPSDARSAAYHERMEAWRL